MSRKTEKDEEEKERRRRRRTEEDNGSSVVDYFVNSHLMGKRSLLCEISMSLFGAEEDED